MNTSRHPNLLHAPAATPATNRRRTSLGAAAIVMVMALLAACGSNEASSDQATSTSTEQSASSQPPETSLEPTAPVTQAAVAVPIAAGQTENWKTALADLIGPRYDEYQSSRTRYGLDQQTTTLQSTPMGDFALIYMEGADINKTVESMATSPEEWDVDWRDMTTGLHGVDFNDPDALKVDVHLVMNTGDLTAEQRVGLQPLNFMIPLKEDESTRQLRRQLDNVMAERGDEYRQARAKIGVAEEKVFLENTAAGPALVIYWEAADPAASIKALFASTDPFDTWFADKFFDQHLVDSSFLGDMLSKNILVADYPRD